MASLGSLGALTWQPLVFELARNGRSLDRAGNPVRAVLGAAGVPGWEEDDRALGGSVHLPGGAPVRREVRALHRDSGALLARSWSSAVDGSFLIRVPPCAEGVDLHILSEPGDGCDLYLQHRTPVDD